jgi:nicotinate-nucleotide adenylyltransferase
MGADNLAGFHRWQHWQMIANSVPFAVIDRPGATFRAASSIAAHRLAKFRLDESDAGMLARSNPPAWVMLHGKRSTLSSTLLREKTT